MTLSDGRIIVRSRDTRAASAVHAQELTATGSGTRREDRGDSEDRVGDSLHAGGQGGRRASTIVMHPAFRVIVLANRPGWPFLGNDFFREVG